MRNGGASEEVEEPSGFDSDSDVPVDGLAPAATTGPAAARAAARRGTTNSMLTAPAPSSPAEKVPTKAKKKAASRRSTKRAPFSSRPPAAVDQDAEELYGWEGNKGMQASYAKKAGGTKEKYSDNEAMMTKLKELLTSLDEHDAAAEASKSGHNIGDKSVYNAEQSSKRDHVEKVLDDHGGFNPKVKNIKSVLEVPGTAMFADYVFMNSWTWLLFLALVIDLVLILIFAALLVIQGQKAVYGCRSHGDADFRYFEHSQFLSEARGGSLDIAEYPNYPLGPNATDADIQDYFAEDYYAARTPPCVDLFEHAFYLSVQTFTTVGYGTLQPATVFTHLLIALEGYIALLYATVIGGAMFLKLIKPIPRVVFSNKIVIFHKGVDKNPRLRFQSVLGKDFKMFYTSAVLKVHMAQRDLHGKLLALKDFKLPLTLDEHAVMSSSVIYTHDINSESPLVGLTRENIKQHVLKFSLVVQGDESKGFMTTYSGRTWDPEDVYFGHKFKSWYTPNRDPDELGTFDASKIHEIEECAESTSTRDMIKRSGRNSISRRVSTEDNDMYMM